MFVRELGRAQRQKVQQRPGEQQQRERGVAEEIAGPSHRADQRATLAHVVRQRSDIRTADAQRTARLDRRLRQELVRRVRRTNCRRRRRLTRNRFLFSVSSERVVQSCQKIPDLKYELIGSWSVHVGDLDQYVHLWKHRGGYAAIDKTNNILMHDKVSRHDGERIGRSCVLRRHINRLLLSV